MTLATRTPAGRRYLTGHWLRVTPADRDRYLQAKRELAQRTWRHVQHYADAKTGVIKEIMDRAGAAA